MSHLEFAMKMHNRRKIVFPIRLDNVTILEIGGVADYLEHDYEGYDESEDLEVEYKIKNDK